MEQLREMIARVARSQAPVHISGESGTGKELVARLIHESGARRERPVRRRSTAARFPPSSWKASCSATSAAASPGAVADKKGLVQSAEGGTLFLDEVADLPLHMQVKLLRVIQEKTVRPVGESREEPRRRAHPVRHAQEPRATWSPQGRFREDLFYRINVIELRVPALRERGEDIAELAEAILRAPRAPLEHRPRRSISPEAIAALQTYPFPGNVRELENILERALTLSTGGVIAPEHIQLRAATRAAADDRTRSPSPAKPPDAGGAHRLWAASSRTSSATPSSRRSSRPATTRPRRRSCSA